MCDLIEMVFRELLLDKHDNADRWLYDSSIPCIYHTTSGCDSTEGNAKNDEAYHNRNSTTLSSRGASGNGATGLGKEH